MCPLLPPPPIGLAGLVAAACGCEVVLTDRADTLSILSANCRAAHASGATRSEARAACVCFGEDASQLAHGATLALAADVLYAEGAAEQLARSLLALPGLEHVLLSHTHRDPLQQTKGSPRLKDLCDRLAQRFPTQSLEARAGNVAVYLLQRAKPNISTIQAEDT